MKDIGDHRNRDFFDVENDLAVNHLAQQWAKKYLHSIKSNKSYEIENDAQTLADVASPLQRKKTAKKLLNFLSSATFQAWNQTNALLSEEIKRHNIDTQLINPWEIAAEASKIYSQALDIYGQQIFPKTSDSQWNLIYTNKCSTAEMEEVESQNINSNQLSTIISPQLGMLRQKYTQKDPKVIGVVCVMFHYTSQMLLQTLSPWEQVLVGGYFKVIDDHLYIPLQRAYKAATVHDKTSPALAAVQTLLPISTQIAKKISQKIIELNPHYYSLSGSLNDSPVKTSSIRDVEMFQVYLWICTLEGSVAAIQQELFPLCVMLYPKLNIQWHIVRQMLQLLEQEISQQLNSEQFYTLLPYLHVLWQMFSPQVFEEFDFLN
ncbi:hypothetical protein [Calothrix sp. 336/3]|uniref:hypothetical protein n=1 Tax=Calothrix sp. 336/3 TaxID=1337936 RepID=UPI0004E2DCDF|nr:hypothetical protein [Calothrix sp. 336/3]AKG24052.1 hypothetical protein IJ00_24515 [Calothrix sp. 336/3]